LELGRRETRDYTVTMNLALPESGLPIRIRLDRPMTDEELMRFCASNDGLRVEREANGEILVMTPAGFRSSRMNSRIIRLLDEWAEANGRGLTSDSNGGYTLPDNSLRAPMRPGSLCADWNPLARRIRNGLHRSVRSS
jgi:Uma2 family endonuclease